MLKLGIIGHGFVGKAIDYAFSTPSTEIYRVDPKLGSTIETMYEHFVPDIVFVSVPTPMSASGSIDPSIIKSVVTELPSDVLVVIKSTVTPDVLEELHTLHNNLVFNPEFLTERRAEADFIYADFLLFGGELAKCEYVKSLYDRHSKCAECPVVYVDLKTASLIKYTLNCYKASKVLFFNQIFDIFTQTGSTSSWNDFVQALRNDSLIGPTHMQVPGPDGRFGYGGACFPKDTAAFAKYAQDLGVPFTALEEIIQANQKIRSQYELTDREVDQNVRFDQP
jgi:UDPglucose 6-dehydrogenase